MSVQLIYDYNANTVCFDGIQLFKEEFGTVYTYDDEGHVTSVTDEQGQTATYEYTDDDLTKETLSTGEESSYTYDDSHNLLTEVSSDGTTTTYTYDAYGNNTSVTVTGGESEKAITTYATYSEDGNYLVSTTDALGKVTTYSYNAETGVLEWVQYPNDTEATRTTYTYDSMYRMVGATADTDTGLSLSANYTYTDDQLTALRTPSTTYSFTYGDFSLADSVMIGSRTLVSYTYDEYNRLKVLDYGNDGAVEYTYDAQGNVIQETYEDGATVSYLYDNDRALSKVIDSATGITTTYYYDFSGRLMKYTEIGADYSHSVSYTYSDSGNLLSQSETVNGTTTTYSYTYDDQNRVSSMSVGDTTVTYTYDAFGRITHQKKYYGEVNIATDRLYYTVSDNGGYSDQIGEKILVYECGNLGTNITYQYDDNGNITQYAAAEPANYTYDSAGQLIREDNRYAPKIWTWTYDNAGNILSRTEYAYTMGELGEPLDIVTYGYSDSEWGDLLTSYNGQTITYDAIGNPLSDGTWSYTWKHGRQLASMTNGSATWTYTYDVNGMRTQRTNGTDTYTYVYNGSQLTTMTKGDDTLCFTYDAAGTPLTLTYNGALYYYLTNAQGDVLYITDTNGNIVVSYAYDAWGNVVAMYYSMASTLGQINPLRYRGYVYDNETGLYYLQSRYYNPEWGRFINADSVEIIFENQDNILQNNLFAYAWNNPVNMADYTGESPASIIGAIAGGVTGAALGYLLAKKLGLSGWKKAALIAAATVGGAALGAFLGPYIAKLTKMVASSVKTTAKKVVKTVAKQTPKSLCFIAGTLVESKNGHTPIEDIKVGDYVYAENPETGEKSLKRVVQTYINQTDELVHVNVDNQTISATPDHPFYSPPKGWIKAVDLRVGDELVLRSGDTVVVEDVRFETLETTVTVYNFEVEDFHTYYVTSSSVLVHNLCAKEFIKSPKNAKQILSYLKEQGFKTVSQNGSHVKLVKGSKTVIVPNHGAKDIAIGTLKSIMKQAGLL